MQEKRRKRLTVKRSGFFCPPMGVIDGSVLTAVGLLLMFSVLARLPEAIKAGRSVKIQKGDFSAEVMDVGQRS